jgi:hypothetical protein
MRISLRTTGLFDPREFARWEAEKRRELRRAAVQAFRDELPPLRERLRANMRTAFDLKRQTFAQVMTYKLFAARPDRLPAAQVGALRAPWLEAHEVGATVRGKGAGLLIPLNQPKRLGRRAFQRIVEALMKQGNAFFKRVNGKVILFAENIKESAALTARFRRPIRKGLGGGRLKRSAEIPIAVLVPQVRLRKRLRVQQLVGEAVPRIAVRMQRNMRLG